VLEANVRSGTGTRARIPGQHAAGKTGTAQGSGDAWFVGFTPYLSTAVWLGSPDDNERVVIRGSEITGGVYPAEIWGRYMRAWHEGLPERDYRAADGTRGGRYLHLPPAVDAGGGFQSTTSSTLVAGVPPPFSVPTGFPFPSIPGTTPRPTTPRPTAPPNRPTTPAPTTPTTNFDDRFPPGFPFDD
jgi:penicillin-binding protein 1A